MANDKFKQYANASQPTYIILTEMYNQVKRISQNSKALRKGRNTISLSNIASEQLEFNEGKSIFVDFEPLLKSSSNLKFDEAAFKESYQKSLELLHQKNDVATKSAASLLSHLCLQLKYASASFFTISIPFDIIQGAVFHFWKLKNQQHRANPTEQSKIEILHFLREYVEILSKIYDNFKAIRSKSLSSLYLILAKEQFDGNELKAALNYSDVSCNYIYGPRNYVHMIKVHFLKSKIYNLMNNVDKELEEMKKCEKNLRKLLSPNLNEGTMNEFGKEIMMQLDMRKQEIKKETAKIGDKLKTTEKDEKESAVQNKKRSLSLIKLKRPDQQNKKTVNLSTEKGKASASMHISIKYKSQSKSKLQTGNRQLLRLDINLPSKNQTKLRKRPLKIASLKEDVDYTQLLQSQTLKLLQDVGLQGLRPAHQDLLLQRPNAIAVKRVEKAKESKKEIEQQVEKEEVELEKQVEVIHYKEEQQPQMHHHHNSVSKKQKFDELIREIIRPFQESILQKHINKINFFNEHSQQSNREIIQEEDIPINQQIEIALNHFVIKQKFIPADSVQRNILFTSQYQYLHEQQLCMSFGILTAISIRIQVQKIENKNKDISYQQLELTLKTVLQEIGDCECKLQFILPAPLNQKENSIEKILVDLTKGYDDSIKKKVQPKEDPELLKEQLLLLLTRNLILSRTIKGFHLSQKKALPLKSKAEKYFEHRLAKYELYELNKYTFDRLNSVSNSSDQVGEEANCNATTFIVWKIYQSTELQSLSRQSIISQQNLRPPYKFVNFTLNCNKLINHPLNFSNKGQLQLERKTAIFLHSLTYKNSMNSKKQPRSQEYQVELKITDPNANDLILADSFNEKVNNFFQQQSSITRQQFYYCMKFILIKPPSKAKSQTLNNFYDSISVSYLYNLMSKHQVMIKMTCFKVKKMFKSIHELFFKFEFQLKEQRIKMMKFISTHHDISLILRDNPQMRMGAAAFEKHISFDKHSLFNLLKLVSQCIFLKKDFMYFSIGFQTCSSTFSFINKFRLEGKAIQSQNFLSPCLKFVNILCQKSIKIDILNAKYYSVMTVIKIERANTFSILIYIPKIQRSYSFTLTKAILHYLSQDQLDLIFNHSTLPHSQLTEIMFENCKSEPERQTQRSVWNEIIKLMKFQIILRMEKYHVIVKIGDYNAFVKDCSLSEYFQINRKILHLQMSLEKKEKQVIEFSALAKHISKSKKALPFKTDNRPCLPHSQTLKTNEIFEMIKNIYQSDMQKYILYISLTNVYNIPSEKGKEHLKQERESPKQAGACCDNEKINLSFYLSDLIQLIKENHKHSQAASSQSPSEECFSYATLLRTFTSIKYKLINQIKKIDKIEEVFSSSKSFQIQKAIKMRLSMQFKSNKQHPCSLNSEKQYNRYEKSIFLVNKNIISLKKSLISSIFYDAQGKSMQFFISSNENLLTKQQIMPIQQSPFPNLEFYNKDIFLKANARILKYFKNKLLLIN